VTRNLPDLGLNGTEPSVVAALGYFDQLFHPFVPHNWLRAEGDLFKISYTGETNLRAQLAVLARAFGWLVEEEVVVPGWGRIDLVLRSVSGMDVRLIELKTDLTKPARIRRAFQQADGYGRWWTRHQTQRANVHLVAADADWSAVHAVQAAYPEVGCLDVREFIVRLTDWLSLDARYARAIGRFEAIRNLLAVHELALLNMRRARGDEPAATGSEDVSATPTP
jgi:hypothetical protein